MTKELCARTFWKRVAGAGGKALAAQKPHQVDTARAGAQRVLKKVSSPTLNSDKRNFSTVGCFQEILCSHYEDKTRLFPNSLKMNSEART